MESQLDTSNAPIQLYALQIILSNTEQIDPPRWLCLPFSEMLL